MRRQALLLAFVTLAATAGFSGQARANWVASGTFRYRDRIQDLSGFTGATQDLPVRYARVEIVRSPSTVLASGVTDASGNFLINVTDAQTSTVFARMISVSALSGLNIRVQSSTTGTTTYAVAGTSVANHNPNTNLDFGITTALAGAGGEAFNIFDVMVDGSDYAASLIGAYPALACTTVWSSSSTTGTFFSGSTIRLLAEEGWDDSVIQHEHGHFIDFNYSASDNPGGQHFLGDNNQDIRLSYGEGVATYHMAAGRKVNGKPNPTFYIDSTGGTGPGNLNFSYEIEGPNISALGGASEVAVQAALWDIVDDAGSSDLYPGDDDPLALPVSEVFQVMDVYIPTASNISLEDFWDGWFSPGIMNGNQAGMEATFGALRIEYFADGLESDNTSGTASVITSNGVPQHHSFYAAGDADFARLTSPAPGTKFVIETANLLGDANTAIEVRDHDGTTVLASNDNRGASDESSLLVWTAPGSGDYFIRSVHATDLGVYGSYDLRVIQGTLTSLTFTDVASAAGVNSSRPSRGSAWGDFDNDGDPDLFVTNAAGSAYQLFRNNGNATFTDISGSAGIGGAGVSGQQCVWGDYDNDGDLDIFLAAVGTSLLFRNNGNATFTNVAAAAGVAVGGAGSLGASWSDYDRDGWLDLFVATIGAPDGLYHNNGNGTFSEVGAAAGVAGQVADTFGGTWADYDRDGDPDLFVYNDGMPNHLYRNNGNGTFSDVTPSIMSAENERTWGATWADYDFDGDMDLYVTKLGTNCRLYRNDGGGNFSDQSAPAGVNASASQTSNVIADFDFDLDDDIYVGAYDEPNIYYDNLTGTAYYNSGKIPDPLQARSLTAADFDGDGDLDIHLANSNGNNVLYATSGAAGSWVRFKLTGTLSNRAAIGATVTLRSGGKRHIQMVSGGSGYISQNDQRLTFGLGNLAGPDTFEVVWPSGAYQLLTGLSRNTTHTVVEPGSVTAVPDPGQPTRFELAQNYPNPSRPQTTIRFNLPTAGPVRLEVFDVSGRLVRRLEDGLLPAGPHETTWDGTASGGSRVSAGIYLYRLTGPGGVLTRKMILQR